MINKRFGRLTVVSDSGIRKSGGIYWNCVCDCGNSAIVRTSNLKSGKTNSCGCLAKECRHQTRKRIKPIIRKSTLNNLGLKINRVKITDFIKDMGKPLMVKLLCECGNTKIKPYSEFMKGKIKSCGCLKIEISQRAKEKKINKIPKQYSFIPPKDFSNKRFGKLVVLYFCGVRINKRGLKHSLWYCQCDCGNFVIKTCNAFKNKNISCDCINKDKQAARARAITKKKQQEREKLINSGIITRNTIDHKHRRLKKTVRNMVFQKYGNMCLICGKKDTEKNPLCIHHLKPHWLYKQYRYFIINNIPLCRKCHDELHRKFNRWNPPALPQIEYIKNMKHVFDQNKNT